MLFPYGIILDFIMLYYFMLYDIVCSFYIKLFFENLLLYVILL